MKKIFLTIALTASVAMLSAQTSPAAKKKAETKKECSAKENGNCCMGSKAKVIVANKNAKKK